MPCREEVIEKGGLSHQNEAESNSGCAKLRSPTGAVLKSRRTATRRKRGQRRLTRTAAFQIQPSSPSCISRALLSPSSLPHFLRMGSPCLLATIRTRHKGSNSQNAWINRHRNHRSHSRTNVMKTMEDSFWYGFSRNPYVHRTPADGPTNRTLCLYPASPKPLTSG